LTQGAETAFAAILKGRLPRLRSSWLDPADPTEEQLRELDGLARVAGTVVVATRNAHLNPLQLEAVKRHLDHLSVLVCLRNPYDAGIISTDTVILTLGDSEPSLRAAADALIGDYKPKGRINVPLKT